jgi:KaiC/GvpD/RAD55 family RecA-like ATPase
MPKIPLIEDLTEEPVPPGSTILVEFGGASQWYNASIAITVGWIRSGGKVSYSVFTKPPDSLRSQIKDAGLDTEELERTDKLRIWDFYSATLGQKSKEKHAQDSLKIAELSIQFSRETMRQPPQPEWLRVVDNEPSTLVRFNDEKSVVEFLLTRHFPSHGLRRTTAVFGLLKGVHSTSMYEQLEAASEGIIDFKLEEEGKSTRDLIRIRNMRNVHFDREWHELKIGDNFEVTLEK